MTVAGRTIFAFLTRVPVIVFVAACVVFASTVGFDFVNWDDNNYVTENPHVLYGPSFLSADFWLPASHGYPLVVPFLTYSLNHVVHGLDPSGYHLVNVLIHAFNAVLLFRWLEQLGLSRVSTLAAVVVFAFHPIVAEPVSWISARKDLLVTSFTLGALALWFRESRTKKTEFLATVVFALACLSKPGALAIPFAVFALRRFRSVSIVPSLAISVALVVFCMNAASHTRVFNEAPAGDFGPRVFRSIGLYFSHFLAPFDLRSTYILAQPTWLEPATILGLSAVLLGGAFALTLKGPPRIFLVLLAATLLPISNAVPLNRVAGDSLFYLPLVFVAALVAVSFERFTVALAKRYRVIAVVALAALLAPLAFAQSSIWRNGIALWTHALAYYPHSPQVCENVGVAYAKANDHAMALELFEGCSKRQGNRPYFLFNMVLAARDSRDGARFQSLLRELVATQPDHPMSKAVLARESAKQPR